MLITDEVNAINDPGAGEKILERIMQKHRIDIVIDTHYHFDHIWFNYLFRDAEIYLNKYDSPCFGSPDALAERLGMLEVYGADYVDKWKKTISREISEPIGYSPKNRHEWMLSTSRLDGEYENGETFDFGNTKAKVLHMPGRTAGSCCFSFPNEKLVYTADMDLTSFGPWYGGSDGGIQAFLDSIEKSLGLKADTYATGHEMGVVGKSQFLTRLRTYKSKIFERDRSIVRFLRNRKNGATLTEMASQGLIYNPEFLVDEWIYMWEKNMIKKHLDRLESLGSIYHGEDKYCLKES